MTHGCGIVGIAKAAPLLYINQDAATGERSVDFGQFFVRHGDSLHVLEAVFDDGGRVGVIFPTDVNHAAVRDQHVRRSVVRKLDKRHPELGRCLLEEGK